MRKNTFPRGFVQVYTGNGKGKTTAALGLALRAAGHRFHVLMIQFLKRGAGYGEWRAAKKLGPYFTMIPMGRENFVHRKNIDPEDLRLARKGWKLAKEAVRSRKYQMVILDEINVAVEYGMISVAELLDLIKNKPAELELVLTGRWAKPAVLRCADLITEMREKKHYYTKGIVGRKGIER